MANIRVFSFFFFMAAYCPIVWRHQNVFNQVLLMDRGAWPAAVHSIAKSQTEQRQEQLLVDI